MSRRSEIVPISSVTTMVNLFEIRKQQNRIGFGDLEDLKKIFDVNTCQHVQYRRFSNGNYSVSVLNYSDTKRVVVIHQENVDPSLVAEKTMQPDAKASIAVNKSNKTVFGPSDWFGSQRASSAVGWENQMKKKRRLDQPGGTSASGDGDSGQSVWRSLGLNLVWKSGEEMVSDRERMKQIDLSGLLYFADDFHYDQVQIAYSSDGVYKLTLNNIEIGFAVNLAAIITSNVGYTGILFEDSYNGSFALLVFSSDEIHPLQISNPSKYIAPISSCLFDNVYRSFYTNGVCIDNPYYGSICGSDFDFTRLPDHVFVKILRQLPMGRRVHCRRVSQHWLSMANLAIAVDSKNVNTNEQFYYKLKPDHFQSFLPVVSDCLEVLELHESWMTPAALDAFFAIASFPVLQKLNFETRSISVDDALFYVLDRSPKLEILKTPIPSTLAMQNASHGPYAVKKLTVRGYDANDPQLVAFLEYFPNLYSLCIECKYLTASCISWVLEKYGPKLRHFILPSGSYFYSKVQSSLPFGAATGIQACTNLTYLNLYHTTLVSDVFIGALVATCHKLETVDIPKSNELTNGGLAALAVLPNLTKLNISKCQQDLNGGMTSIARQGRLIELKVRDVKLSSTCLKTIVSQCTHLKLFDIGNGGDLTMGHAAEIVRLYGTRSMEACLILRSWSGIWRSVYVRRVIDEVKKTNQRHFQVQ